jgi:hypothetical protein
MGIREALVGGQDSGLAFATQSAKVAQNLCEK